MLQRYDLSMDGDIDRLSIKEFAVLGRTLRKSDLSEPSNEDFIFIHEVTYDGDTIRAAIKEGREGLISELRSDDFFPIRPCAEVIADGVIELFENHSDPFPKLFFDDRTLFSSEDETA